MAGNGYKFGECRVMFGHAWGRVGPLEAGKVQGSWRVNAMCERCVMRRRSVIDAKGRVTSRVYLQPEGYRLTREIKRETLRLATLQGWRKA